MIPSARGAFRHQPFERAGMVEQRVASGEQETVGVRAFEREFARLDAVHAEAPALDHLLVAQPRERPAAPDIATSNTSRHASP